jgi:transposase
MVIELDGNGDLCAQLARALKRSIFTGRLPVGTPRRASWRERPELKRRPRSCSMPKQRWRQDCSVRRRRLRQLHRLKLAINTSGRKRSPCK